MPNAPYDERNAWIGTITLSGLDAGNWQAITTGADPANLSPGGTDATGSDTPANSARVITGTDTVSPLSGNNSVENDDAIQLAGLAISTPGPSFDALSVDAASAGGSGKAGASATTNN